MRISGVPVTRLSLSIWIMIGLSIATVAVLAYRLDAQARHVDMERQLMAASAGRILADPALLRFATDEARPLFAAHCASCHGADRTGNPAIGAPDLTDRTWLYGGGIDQIQRIILYGIRSGRSKARDLTEMPAFGQRGQLDAADISNLVQYLRKLGGQPHDAPAAVVGEQVYRGRGRCVDCHAGDAKGDSFSGVPDLTAGVWNYGGTPKAIHDSIYFGRHGVMPAWVDTLSLAQSRALATYLLASARR